jgi:glycosyltransferase involved in cell wall biosynthesis
LELAKAVARRADSDNEIWLVMNGAFDGLIDLQKTFSRWIPRDRMRVFDIPLPAAEIAGVNSARCRSAELVREFFVAQLEPDAVLVTSLFEGFVDDAVVSVGNFIPGKRTAVVLYDLIPFLNPERYLGTSSQRRYYECKIASLRRAGLLLAISDSARQEAIDHLGIAAQQVVAISTAVDERFHPGPPLGVSHLRSLGLVRPFVMYAPGGTDARKNLHGLVTAFATLPAPLRHSHQLLIASAMDDSTRASLLRHAAKAGLSPDTLVLSGYVDDALLIGLYRSCSLFVFPSLHEGFGLPALEAMACGAAVIGADNSSIPEVIGLDEALFDAGDPAAMATAMARGLSDSAFRERLLSHGKDQSKLFSWDLTAERCLQALRTALPKESPVPDTDLRRRLAFVSPLPPERSGIADYAAQLLPALMGYFDIDLIVQQAETVLPPELAHLPLRSVAWFLEHAGHYDQILYQFGNSPFHGHMFAMLEAHPGVVVLHDFYLSRVLAYEQMTGASPGAWTDALYHSHGYAGLAVDLGRDGEMAHEKFPCNLAVLQNATTVIVHSRHSKALATDWYGAAATHNWHVVPLPRAEPRRLERAGTRQSLGVGDDVFMVCSFGFIAPSKLTHRLIAAWQVSALANDPRCMLVLVGANHGGSYGQEILSRIGNARNANIMITGWIDDEAYHGYLSVADVAVQLRCASRGETSAAALDCLNYGLPTIVNANGSMAELPPDAVCMLDEDFDVSALSAALERLYRQPAQRREMGATARTQLAKLHSPAHCAAIYAKVLAQEWATAPTSQRALTTALATVTGSSAQDLQQTAAALARLPDSLSARQLFIDVTTIAKNDLRTGIERVVRAQILALLRQPGRLRVEPVRLDCIHGRWQYRYAHAWTQSLLDIKADGAPDHVVDLQAGDILFGADYAPIAVAAAAQQGLYEAWNARGVSVQFQVFDLLPVLQPQFFPVGADHTHAGWLAAIGAAADQLVCISAAVATDTANWLAKNATAPTPRIVSCHLGADFDGARPAPAVRTSAHNATPIFLMVGTIEPRKGHLQTLAAFELLWQRGVDVALTVVGVEGWTALAAPERRSIPQIVMHLHHLKDHKNFTWLPTVTDAELEQLYLHSACLLAPSEGEGFGLPLIEAARYQLPILARDLPVFREVGGDSMTYFHGTSPADIANAVETWLARNSNGDMSGTTLPWQTWDAHAQQLIAKIQDGASRAFGMAT